MINNYSKNDIEAVLIASLLHDVGKFEQRKGIRKKHAIFGQEFIIRNMGQSWEKAAKLISAHHDVDSYQEEAELVGIVCLADWLSASERERDPGSVKKIIENYLLHSIFSKLNIDQNNQKSNQTFFPLSELKFDLNSLFPLNINTQESRSQEQSQKEYKNLWNKFENDFSKINFEGNFNSVIITILSLLEQYISFLPSSVYKTSPDISLFSHSKTVCAIAGCIMSVLNKQDVLKYFNAMKMKVDSPLLNEPIIKLVMGDISGIQEFIYSIKSKGALKNLKGKSAYIQMLSELVAVSILKNNNLTNANIMFVGGGNFYLLLPANVDIESESKRVSKILYNELKTDMSIAITGVDINWNDFREGNFGEKWYEVGKLTGIEKRRKNKNILTDANKSSEFMLLKSSNIDEDLPDSKIYEDFARKFTNSNWLYKDSSSKQFIKIFDSNIEFSKSGLPHNSGISINNFDYINSGGYSFKSIVNHAALHDNDIASLEILSERCSSGKKTWGVLRADIDNLGKIFRNGLKKKKDDESEELVTISRISTLSYLISLFFGGHIQTILKQDNFKDKTIAVYSGGDDLFLIGSWDVLPELALQIRNDFLKFTKRDDITISAGIFISPSSKYPISHAAREAGRMLSSAKLAGKNKICFLDDSPLSWDDFTNVGKVKDSIIRLIDDAGKNGSESRSLIRILKESLQASEIKQNEISLPHVYRLVYSLKKWAGRNIDNTQLDKLRETFIDKYKLTPNLKYAVRWAELITRQEK